MKKKPQKALDEIKAIVGDKGAIPPGHDQAPYLTDWRGRHTGKSPLVVLPKTTSELSRVMKICARESIPMVPQGGNTGLVQGGVPDKSGKEIVISLSRMNSIIGIDPAQNTALVEAGVVLETLQRAAEEKNRLLPLSLAAEGTCEVGGNIATNAGGIHVMRFGPMRDLVLGLEVVLPNGEVWDGLKVLRKDNTGYDLKQLFIGSEGTLGIITKAALKLFPRPRTVEMAGIAANDLEKVMTLLTRMQESFSEKLTVFEIFPRPALDMVLKHIPGSRDPFERKAPWYILTEVWDTEENPDLRGVLENSLAEEIEKGTARDAVIAQSGEQRKALWGLRENIAEAQKKDGDGIKHDVSVPINKIPAFIRRADEAVEKIVPGFKRVAFGHAGDGNIHYDPCPPEGMDQKTFLSYRDEVNRAVHDIVADLRGSISAEHGIGATRAAELAHYKKEVDLTLLKTLKKALDPNGIMNPGKLF